ncbi:putative oxidoreductase TDA3 [Tripterygium wilfordii]|uniref:Putative oxidoreductase TDA3 n=1 Tax=Tripterygium wilfordii TaxID=458696 RepID=A0A7J7E2N9_TRIWF|nr:putative oxidoreductase TDA3 [Tripterygium wilfordii]
MASRNGDDFTIVTTLHSLPISPGMGGAGIALGPLSHFSDRHTLENYSTPPRSGASRQHQIHRHRWTSSNPKNEWWSVNGAAVTLVEKSSVACAASGKAGGFLALDWCDGGPLSSLARASFHLHRSLAQELNGPESYGYRSLTTLSLTVNESKISSGDNAIPSWVDGPVRSPRTIGSTETTAQVHPRLFTRTLLTKATESYGVDVVIGKLERVEVEGGRVGSVVLEGGRVIETDAVVLALGPWSSKLELLRSLFRVYGLKAHSIVIEPKEPDAITPHALFLSYYPARGYRTKPLDPEVYSRPNAFLKF